MTEFRRQKIDASKLPPRVLEKWPQSVLAEGFVPFPKTLLRRMHRLFPDSDSMKQLAVLLAIADFRRPNLSRSPSVDFLAFVAGLEKPDFQRALDQLAEKGYVRVSGDAEGLEVSMDGLAGLLDREEE